jgi:hypothetical protein
VLALGFIEERAGFRPHPGFSKVDIHGLHEYGREGSSSRVG